MGRAVEINTIYDTLEKLVTLCKRMASPTLEDRYDAPTARAEVDKIMMEYKGAGINAVGGGGPRARRQKTRKARR
jgi:hypothetical protein